MSYTTRCNDSFRLVRSDSSVQTLLSLSALFGRNMFCTAFAPGLLSSFSFSFSYRYRNFQNVLIVDGCDRLFSLQSFLFPHFQSACAPRAPPRGRLLLRSTIDPSRDDAKALPCGRAARSARVGPPARLLGKTPPGVAGAPPWQLLSSLFVVSALILSPLRG